MAFYQKTIFQSGLSLLGVVVAVVLLASSAVFITRLVVENNRLASMSRDKLLAVNIAREGLELARAIRDTNTFREGPSEWTAHLCPADPDGIKLSYLDVDDWIGGMRANPLSAANYEHDGAFARFDRTIEVNCDNSNVASDEVEKYIEVTSIVEWQYRQTEQSVILKERLYDWI